MATTRVRGQRDFADSLAAVVAADWVRLCAFADAVVGLDRALAEDCVQDALLAVYRSARARELSQAELRAYVVKAVRNAALNSRRRPTAGTADLASIADRAGSPFEHAVARDLRAALRDAISALPPAQRDVFLLSRYEGKSRNEIAAELRVSPHTVSNYLGLALKTLRGALVQHLE